MMKWAFLIFFLFPYFCLAQDHSPVEDSSIPLKAYTVQVFSSKDKSEAKEKGTRFNEFNHTFLWPKKIKKNTWFRVCVGVFNKKVEADAQLEKIKAQDPKSDAFVINLINN